MPVDITSQMNRREVLTLLGVAAGAVFCRNLPGAAATAKEKSPATKPTAELKLCSQEGRLPGKTLAEKLENLKKFGGVGFEVGGKPHNRIKEIRTALAASGVSMAAVCAGYFPLIDPDRAKRVKGAEELMQVLDTAGELGATGVIVVPAFNKHPQLDFQEGRKVLVDALGPLGDHAHKVGTRILLEPLNKGEEHFINRLEVAAAICRDSHSPGACLMGDFYHMAKEESDDQKAFEAGGIFVHHVHLASRSRKLPGQDDRSFVAGFKGLKKIGYHDFCSLECGCNGDPMVEIPKAFALLKQQWTEATV